MCMSSTYQVLLLQSIGLHTSPPSGCKRNKKCWCIMLAEAHRKHKGIGTLLVKKVGQFNCAENASSSMSRSEDSDKRMTDYNSPFESLFFLLQPLKQEYWKAHRVSCFTGVRFQKRWLVNLVSWWLIQRQASCCIMQRSQKHL